MFPLPGCERRKVVLHLKRLGEDLKAPELGEVLLELFEKEYDMVLLDTPPMLHIPDARILGRMSDAVMCRMWHISSKRE